MRRSALRKGIVKNIINDIRRYTMSYFQSSRSNSFLGSLPEVTKNLLIIKLLVPLPPLLVRLMIKLVRRIKLARRITSRTHQVHQLVIRQVHRTAVITQPAARLTCQLCQKIQTVISQPTVAQLLPCQRSIKAKTSLAKTLPTMHLLNAFLMGLLTLAFYQVGI